MESKKNNFERRFDNVLFFEAKQDIGQYLTELFLGSDICRFRLCKVFFEAAMHEKNGSGLET